MPARVTLMATTDPATAAATVAFLRQPQAFPEGARHVHVIETHMSWVFLSGVGVYKLKKPIRFEQLDFSSAEQRRLNCEAEVCLNRRLAPGVYLGVVAVTRRPDGTLALGGHGEVVDWLVHMRRLPAEYMLDAVIGAGRAEAEHAGVLAAAAHLARFYRAAQAVPISGAEHRALLAEGVHRDLRELSDGRYGLPRDKLTALADAQLQFLTTCPLVFDERIAAGRIVDGHGDLRPEHICLRPDPVVIDCLEFAAELRRLDPADELSFLVLECDVLGAPRVGRWFLDTYTRVTGDTPPASLLHFYRVYRALRRTTIAVRHLDDPTVRDKDRFAARARRYLELVRPVAIDPPTGGR